ncbi:uberolysin/carnocyclin family circular bacteriocin [Bacillus sp. 1NLA3E]|uniref:uberolysin/carnocyclin family circular bacteriocin n=1 Tax=Bacillus sp. 1NLA3E TaxID=666686 RepID=UPI000247E3EA|nr:uberolysin/carnocyclin family circular bacteriocin [Bacillus sp. 1NLA3E]AGK53194.1 peptide antibiotic precursor [Bacillus sp. 1NLA3E]
MLEAMGFFGVGKTLATQIVNVVDAVGYAAIAVSTIMAILSAGGLAPTAAAIDFAIIYIKKKIANNLKAQAIVW